MTTHAGPRYEVALRCGASLWFSSSQHLPGVGDPMPCSRHTYCEVTRVQRATATNSEARRARRGAGRSVDELVDFLQTHDGATTFSALLRQRFTLRALREAELRRGVRVDWAAERIDGDTGARAG